MDGVTQRGPNLARKCELAVKDLEVKDLLTPPVVSHTLLVGGSLICIWSGTSTTCFGVEKPILGTKNLVRRHVR